MNGATIRLTTAQALVRWLTQQFTEIDGVRVPRSRARERVDGRGALAGERAGDGHADDQRAAALHERLAAELLLVQEARHLYAPPFAITASRTRAHSRTG